MPIIPVSIHQVHLIQDPEVFGKARVGSFKSVVIDVKEEKDHVRVQLENYVCTILSIMDGQTVALSLLQKEQPLCLR